MKKTNYFLFFLLGFVWLFSVSNANAQITFETLYTSNRSPVFLTTLENSGDKYVVYNEIPATLNLYNLNHSLWKTINIDTIALGISPNSGPYSCGVWIPYIKENLFDLDGQVEFIAQFSCSFGDLTAIIDESGQPIMVFDSAIIATEGGEFFQPIRNTSNGTKLITQNEISNEFKVYSLPGTLTCNPCGGVSGIVNPSNNAGRMPSKAFPVPAEKSITIQYELPKGSKSGTIEIHKVSGEQIEIISIGPAFADITVPVSIYSGGVYLYTVKSADGSIVSTGKFIVN